jgi:hypothetical protein
MFLVIWGVIMRTYFFAFFCFLVLPVVASSVENIPDVVQISTPLQEIILPKAHEWAELCLPNLSARDRAMICMLLNISYQFAEADLKLKKAARKLFDVCCLIQDKAQRFVNITEDTEYLKQMASEVDLQVKAYNANLEIWNRNVDEVNEDHNEGILKTLREADRFTAVYINAFLQQGRTTIGHELYNTINANLRQSEIVHNISLSILESLRSLKDNAMDLDEIMSSSFELARVHFCNEVTCIKIMRELFEIQEELLTLRKVVANVFYEAALPYCQGSGQELISA